VISRSTHFSVSQPLHPSESLEPLTIMGNSNIKNGHGYGCRAHLNKDEAMPTLMGRRSDKEDEMTSLLVGKEHHLTQPRRRGEKLSSAQKYSWTFEHTFDYSPDSLEEDENEKVKVLQEDENEKVKFPNFVIDWKNVATIVLCKQERCESNHPLLPNNLWDATEDGPVCNVCMKNIGLDGGLLSCRECDWDICPDCNALRN